MSMVQQIHTKVNDNMIVFAASNDPEPSSLRLASCSFWSLPFPSSAEFESSESVDVT